MFKVKSEMLRESSKSHASPDYFSVIMSFIIVFLIIYFCEIIIPVVLTIKPLMSELSNMVSEGAQKITFKESFKAANKVTSPPEVMIPMLLSTVFGTIISMIYCRMGEMRSLSSMGVKKKKALPHYLLGLAVGILLMTVIVLLSAAVGVQKIELRNGINFGLIALYALGWFFQGMSEEFVFRGYLMTTVGGKHAVEVAVCISSAAFALAHVGNPGFGVLVFINLFLFGALAAVYMLLFDDIWGGCAMHSVWNFTQGNFYGISVSGTNETESVFRASALSESRLLTGGTFGIEGSIFTTIVLIGAIAVVYVVMKKKGLIEKQKRRINSE